MHSGWVVHVSGYLVGCLISTLPEGKVDPVQGCGERRNADCCGSLHILHSLLRFGSLLIRGAVGFGITKLGPHTTVSKVGAWRGLNKASTACFPPGMGGYIVLHMFGAYESAKSIARL